VNEDRPFLQIPLPSEEDRRLFEEWLRRKQKEEKDKRDEHIVIIDI
jgi:hypothetical protein